MLSYFQCDQILMKKRWELIQSGTGREHISIRGGSLFVSKIKKGSVVTCLCAYVEYECNDDVDNATPTSESSLPIKVESFIMIWMIN